MKETFSYLSRYATKEYLLKNNEKLVEIYKNAQNEYEKSQSYSALFVNNFTLFLQISNKYNYVDSSEKASMISEELLHTIEDYDGSTKFITYACTRIDNMFVWKASKDKKRIEMQRNTISSDTQEDEEDELFLQIEDINASQQTRKAEFIMSIDHMFSQEIAQCDLTTLQGRKYRQKLSYAKDIVEILLEDSTLVADQIARKMGWFKKDSEGKYIYTYSKKFPDVIRKIEDGKLVVKEQPIVREACWYKVNKMTSFIKDLFKKYDLIQLSHNEKAL